MTNTFHCGIIGAGVAGSFAAYKISKEYKAKTILFDLGRPPAKRRPQIIGFLGCLPNSDGKFYISDLNKTSKLVKLLGLRAVKSSFNYFNKVLSNIGEYSQISDKSPSVSAEKRLQKFGFTYSLNDYIQIYPKDIHNLSKLMNTEMEDKITYCFDSEVVSIIKQKGMFIINTENEEYKCKKLIFAVGRSGWRYANDVYSKFGIITNNDIARFGIRIECNAFSLKDFNQSNCLITKEDIEVGPLSWHGTVIPEDHFDTAISTFRSNEERWKSDKVSFNLIGKRIFPNGGFEQADRLAKLIFILTNERIAREKITTLLNNKSKISIIKEFDWLKEVVMDVSNIIPDILKSYYHIPTVIPMAPEINLDSNLESEVKNMFVVGEAAGMPGLLSAACMGLIAADKVCE